MFLNYSFDFLCLSGMPKNNGFEDKIIIIVHKYIIIFFFSKSQKSTQKIRL